MATYTVIVDACVMYPAPLLSYLLYLAQTGLDRTRKLMSAHMPDCLIEGYESLVESIELPDLDDKHIVAAAIKGQAEGIITFNLKDFPDEQMVAYELSAIHPDTFLTDMFELSSSAAIQAAQRQRSALKNPPMSVDDYLDCLLRQKLPMFV